MPTLLVLPAINVTRELGAMPKRSMSMLMLRVSMARVEVVAPVNSESCLTLSVVAPLLLLLIQHDKTSAETRQIVHSDACILNLERTISFGFQLPPQFSLCTAK